MKNRLRAVLAVAAGVGLVGCGEDRALPSDTKATALGTSRAELAAEDEIAVLARLGADICGSGYKFLASLPFRNLEDTVISYVNVYFNAKRGKNCAVNLAATETWGDSLYRRVEIGLTDYSRTDVDEGQFRFYAGPVYVHAPRRCIYVAAQTQQNPGFTLFDSGWCG